MTYISTLCRGSTVPTTFVRRNMRRGGSGGSGNSRGPTAATGHNRPLAALRRQDGNSRPLSFPPRLSHGVTTLVDRGRPPYGSCATQPCNSRSFDHGGPWSFPLRFSCGLTRLVLHIRPMCFCQFCERALVGLKTRDIVRTRKSIDTVVHTSWRRQHRVCVRNPGINPRGIVCLLHDGSDMFLWVQAPR